MSHLRTMIEKYALPDLRPRDVREFHEALRVALQDGKLFEQEILELEKLRTELELPDSVYESVRSQLYTLAFDAVTEDDEVTEEEWEEMEQIQDFLGASDAEVQRSKKELYRMRILSELRKGTMPVSNDTNIILKKGEFVHWVEPVSLIKHIKKDPQEAHLTVPGQNLLRSLGTAIGVLPDEQKGDWKILSHSDLIITNQRLLLRGKTKTLSFNLTQILDVQCYRSGIRIFPNRKPPMLLHYEHLGNQNVVGSVLLHAIYYAEQDR